MSSFSGFSEEELKRIKSGETGAQSAPQMITPNNVKPALLGKSRYTKNTNMKLKTMVKQNSDDAIDNLVFDKCKLSLRSPVTPKSPAIVVETNNDNKENVDKNENITPKEDTVETNDENVNNNIQILNNINDRKDSVNITPDIVRGMENYSEEESANHSIKLEQLQLRQKLMEAQNLKRKEMLARALADRTKQTAEEVLRLEKIKKELQVLDSQFSQDVAVLRAKIDQACLSYADAEKHYLRVEKEFLQAKIHLQKEKEKKELLTEHLCALITHNETRKAQKLETLMLELATDKKHDEIAPISSVTPIPPVEDENPVVVDGVDEKTGKMVEITPS